MVTVLPKTWYVVVTKENVDILRSWSNIQHLTPDKHLVGQVYRFWKSDYDLGYNNVDITKDDDIKTGYTFGEELSFSDFERLVLKINKKYELW